MLPLPNKRITKIWFAQDHFYIRICIYISFGLEINPIGFMLKNPND